MTIGLFIVAIIWGSLSAQFLVQTILSFIIASIYLCGIVFSKVSKVTNMIGVLGSLLQSIMFGLLFYGGNSIACQFLTYVWHAIVLLLAFFGAIVYVSPAVPVMIFLG